MLVAFFCKNRNAPHGKGQFFSIDVYLGGMFFWYDLRVIGKGAFDEAGYEFGPID